MTVSFPKKSVFCLLVLCAPALWGQTGGLAQRPYDPVVITGQSLPTLLNQSVNAIKAYRFDAAGETWQAVPFQIDEKDGTPSYFNATDGLLSPTDELVFMAADAGDSAAVWQWPDDASARSASRIALRLDDPLSGETGWLYLYRSETLPLSAETYLTYDAAEDRVESPIYRAAHGSSGFQEVVELKYDDGSLSPDIIDRQKIRLKMKIDMGPLGSKEITLREEMDEDVSIVLGASVRLTVSKRRSRMAPSRVVRMNRSNKIDIRAYANVLGFKLDFQDSLEFTSVYYPAYNAWQAKDLILPELDEGDITELRLTVDQSENAAAMVIQTPLNAGFRVDGFPDDDFDHTLAWPGDNWYLIHANPADAYAVLEQGSIVGIIQLGSAPLGTSQALYYKDMIYNSSDPGDLTSFGETGLQIKGRDITGLFNFYGVTYYLPETLDAMQAETLVNRHLTPPEVLCTPEVYSPVRQITVASAPSGLPVRVDGEGWTTPAVFNWEEGSTHTVSVDSLMDQDRGCRFRFTGWSDGLAASHGVTVAAADLQLTASFVSEAQLITAVLPIGAGDVDPAPPGAWVPLGQPVTVTAIETGWHRFTGWSGSHTGPENPLTLAADSGLTLTAVFGNDAPVLAVQDTAWDEDAAWVIPQDSLWAWAVDDQPDSSLTFALTAGSQLAVDADQPLGGFTVRQTTPNWFGSDTLRLTVTDPLGATASATIHVTVRSQPDAPEPFALIDPANETVLAAWPSVLTFSWQEATDPDLPDSVLYVFELDTTDGFTAPPLVRIGGLHKTTFTLNWPLSYGDGQYFWRVLAVDRAGLATASLDTFTLSLATAVEACTALPRDFALEQNYPNPFNPVTTLRFALPRASAVSLSVYDLRGRKVATLLEDVPFAPGVHAIPFDASHLSSGVYVYRIQAGGFVKMRRMVLLK